MKEPKSNPALTKAFFLLSKRSYSKEILREKLQEKKYSEEDIDLALKKLSSIGFIDDKKFAENLVREYSTFRRYGAYRIKLKLREKKIPEEIAKGALENLSENNQADNLKELVDKCLKKNIKLSREKQYARALAFLLRRGYPYDKSKKALQEGLKISVVVIV